MDIYEGTLLYGNYDEDTFTLKRIKNIFTETSLNERQLTELYSYLESYLYHRDRISGVIL